MFFDYNIEHIDDVHSILSLLLAFLEQTVN